MKLKKFIRNDKSISFGMVLNAGSDDAQTEEEHSATLKQAPLPECDEALQDLVPVVAEIMEFPKAYAKGIHIVGFSVLYTKRDTRSMSITYKKRLDKLDTSHAMSTPAFRIDEPAEGEAGKLETKHESTCESAIIEAKRYIDDPIEGRQQQLLDLKEGKPEGSGTNEDPELANLKVV